MGYLRAGFAINRQKNCMRKNLLFWFAFVLANFLLFQGHLFLFRSNAPLWAWATGVLHVVLLILFPYRKFAKTHETNRYR